MTFEHPGWFIILLLLPLILVGAILTFRKRRKAWDQLVSPRLRKKLVLTTSHWRTWTSLGIALLGLVFLIVSLAQPQAGAEEQEETIRGRNILIAVDTSRSMRVTDIKPSRLDAARTLIFELLDKMPNDRIGILAFANTPHILAPLTVDHGALRETIEQLDHSNIPEGGSNISAVVDQALKVFKETGQRSNALIILSDGEDHGPSLTAAGEAAATEDIPVITIAVGTDDGDLIPDPRNKDGQFRDRNGKPVLSRMRPEALRMLAKQTDGRFAILNSQQDLSSVVIREIQSLQAVDMESRTRRIPNERFQWFVAPAFFLLLGSALIRMRFKRAQWKGATITTLCMIAFVFSSQNSHANALKEAQSAYTKGDYKTAETAFTEAISDYKKLDPKTENPIMSSFRTITSGKQIENLPNLYFGRGDARYKANNFADAQKDFSQALLSKNLTLQEKSHYNLGNTLYKIGESQLKKAQEQAADLEPTITRWTEAVEHYESTLTLNPDNADAQSNLAFVKKQLEQLKQQQQEQKQQDQQQNQDDKDKNEENQDKQESQENQDQQDGDQKQDGQEGDEQQNEQNSPGDEQQDNPEDGSSGENQDQQQGDQESANDSDPNDLEGDQQNQNPSDGQQNQQAQQGQQQPSQLLEEGPREGETPEQYAQRILKEGADMQKNVKRLKSQRERTPDKNW